MQTFLLALLLAASGETGYVLETARGPIELVRNAEVRSVAGGEKSFAAGDRLLLGPAATGVLSDQANRVIVVGPGELGFTQEQLRWNGRQITITSGDNGLQLVLDEGLLQLRGGEARLRREKDALFIEVVKGEANFMGAGGLMAIPANSGIRVVGAQLEKQRLLSPPRPLYPAPHEAMRAFRFRWQPVENATSYQIEVAADPLFTELIYASEVKAAVYAEKARALPIGLLFWRVTAKGAGGFLGLSSEPQPARVAP